MTVAFAFIGFGEAGSTMARTLREAGIERIATYDILVEHDEGAGVLGARASALGVRVAATPAEAVAGADVVISTVVCKQSLAAASAVAPHLVQGQYYMDCNSISPGFKREVADVIAAGHGRFVEAAVMSNVPGNGHRVPMRLGGPGARDLLPVLQPLGFRQALVSDDVGPASASKMVRSVMMKGIEALYLECMRAAAHYGIEQEVLASVDETLAGRSWTDNCHRTMPRSVVHAARRADEMAQVARTLTEIGIEPTMSEATERTLRWCAGLDLKAVFAEQLAEGYPQVLDAIARVERERSPGAAASASNRGRG